MLGRRLAQRMGAQVTQKGLGRARGVVVVATAAVSVRGSVRTRELTSAVVVWAHSLLFPGVAVLEVRRSALLHCLLHVWCLLWRLLLDRGLRGLMRRRLAGDRHFRGSDDRWCG